MKRRFLLLMSVLLTCATLMAEDVIYCRGGLVDTGDWAATELYPLQKNDEGIFVGNVKMTARTEMTGSPTLGWGNRVDLFFDLNLTGKTYCAASAMEQFITPAKTGWRKLQSGTGRVFQCVGGEYTVYFDLENLRVRFEAVEPAWLDEVIVMGTLSGAEWEYNNPQYHLKHQGDGVYTGSIEVVDNGNGLGYFTIFASYAGAPEEGRYSSSVPNLLLMPGVEDEVNRYYGERNWSVAPGSYDVTFDMNRETIRINKPGETEIVTRAYAELREAIASALAEWPDVDLSTCIAVLDDSESTDADYKAAKNSIPGIVKAYLVAKMESTASASNPVDATYLIANADYAKSDGWSGSSMNYANYSASASNTDFHHYQALSGLPSGVYRILVNGVSRYAEASLEYAQPGKKGLHKHDVYLYAQASGIRNTTHFHDLYDSKNDELGFEGEADLTGEGWFAPYTSAATTNYLKNGLYADNCIYAYVNNGALTIGVRREGHKDNCAFVADDWRMSYLGNGTDAMEAFAAAIGEQMGDMDECVATASLKDAFIKAVESASDLQDDAVLADAYTELVQAYLALDASMVAYAIYMDKLEQVKAALEENSELTGPEVALLKKYLTEEEAPGTYSNGSAPYILKEQLLTAEEITAEAAALDAMLENALKGGIMPGTDITALFQNMGLTKANFEGWEEQHTGKGSCNSSHGMASLPVAGWFNMDTFSMKQTLENLPNGIYAFSLNGFYRAADKKLVNGDEEKSAFICVNEFHTPLPTVFDDALPEAEAEVGVNCEASDYIVGDIRFPDEATGASRAFMNNRYAQTAYGIVTDGKLTIGIQNDGYPVNTNDWCIFGNLKVVYLGTNEAAAEELLNKMTERSEGVLAGSLYYREDTRESLVNTLEMDAADAAAMCEKATLLNQYCNAALVTGAAYGMLEEAITNLYTNVEKAKKSGHMSDEKFQTYESLYQSIVTGLFAGTISDEDANKWAEEYGLLAEHYIPLVGRGGLQGVGNWAHNDIYLLYPNDEGWYEGEIKMVDAADLSNGNTWWGNRGDLFFTDSKGVNYGPANIGDSFLTPDHNGPFKIAPGMPSPFQACGGDYMCFINLETLEARFECTREFWMDSVFCIGTLQGVTAWNQWDYTYSLKHTEHGIYKGIIRVEDSGDGKGSFSVLAAFAAGGTEGRYGTPGNGELKHGVVKEASRLNTNCHWTVEAGEWIVTFDMNKRTVRVNRLDDPDYETTDENGEDRAPIYAVGGMLDTGNWEVTEKYPLYKNKDGVYEGVIKFSDQTLVTGPSETHWGNRCDLFFMDVLSQVYGPAGTLNNDERFITPSRTHAYSLAMGNKSQGNFNVFQALSGTYKAFVDTKNLEARFECIEEAWLSKVFAVGTIVGHRWKGYMAEDECNALNHVGNGVYQGLITLEEDNSTRASFAVVTAYNAGNEGRYSPMHDKEEVEADGKPINVYRLNDGGKSISAPVGTWLVTFDWSRGTVSLTDPNNENSIKDIELDNVAKNAPVGIYTLDGKKVYSGMSQWNTARPGIYIQVMNGETKKVLVK